ncbi:MAG TPA: hypothetical protein VM778_04490 [Gemmatimonadota bacterium]|nr:hypothetical protein [Gemmatimonadota bacterium]
MHLAPRASLPFLLTLLAAAPLHGQEPPDDQRLRVTVPSLRLFGAVGDGWFDGDTLSLRSDDRDHRVPLGAIERLERSAGRPSGRARALTGGLIGLAAGLLFVTPTCTSYESTECLVEAGLLYGGIAGLLGAMFGYQTADEAWEEIDPRSPDR